MAVLEEAGAWVIPTPTGAWVHNRPGVQLASETWSTMRFTEGSMRLSTGEGKTPRKMIRAISGAITKRSPMVRSRITAFSPSALPWKTRW